MGIMILSDSHAMALPPCYENSYSERYWKGYCAGNPLSKFLGQSYNKILIVGRGQNHKTV